MERLLPDCLTNNSHVLLPAENAIPSHAPESGDANSVSGTDFALPLCLQPSRDTRILRAWYQFSDVRQ